MTQETAVTEIDTARHRGAHGVDVGALVADPALLSAMAEADEAMRSSGAYERAAEQRAREEAQRIADERASAIRQLRAQGIALKHARILAGELPAIDPPPAPSVHANAWAASPWLLLWLSGPKGCGKSFAAATLVRRFGGRMIPAALLVRHGWWAKLPAKATGLCQDDLLTTPLLAIDDLAQEAEGDRAATIEATEQLICQRCDAGLRTVITTNLRAPTREDLAEHARLMAIAADESAAPAERAKAQAAAARTLESTHVEYFGRRYERVVARFTEYGVLKRYEDAPELRADERERSKRT